MDEQDGERTGSASPAATIGQVEGRCRAWSCSNSSPVSVNRMHAPAKTSMNQNHAVPALRPLCRSLRYEIQPRSVVSAVIAPVARAMLTQPSPPGRGKAT